MNKSRSAILWPGKKELAIENVDIEDPRDGEVLVRIVASGICHTDMVMRDQGVPTPQPVVLGHEGAGLVVKVGTGVRRLKVGDKVTLSFSTCGQCGSCTQGQVAYCHQFFPLNFFGARPDGSTSIRCGEQAIHSHIFGQSSFSTHVVCSERNAVKVDDEVPLAVLAPFGCGFQTGAGAVLKSLQVRPGSSVMIFGAGAVGLSAVMAAKIAGAVQIIAVDIKSSRLELAMEVGATHVVNSQTDDLESRVRGICPQGVNYIVDTTAHLPLIHRGIGLLSHRGSLGLAAAYKADDKITFDVMPFMSTGLTIRGIVEGDTDIQTFIPQLIKHHKRGEFPVDKIIKFFDFADINAAIAASESGEVVKAVVLMP